jgi:hypothetical protein
MKCEGRWWGGVLVGSGAAGWCQQSPPQYAHNRAIVWLFSIHAHLGWKRGVGPTGHRRAGHRYSSASSPIKPAPTTHTSTSH